MAFASIHGNALSITAVVIYGAVLIGIMLKFIYPGRFEVLSLVAYVVMGWMIIAVLETIIKHLIGTHEGIEARTGLAIL